MKSDAKRIEWVDVARGIAIILVMIGHAPGTPKVLSEWLYTFHIPLFFFLSGFVFSAEKYSDIKKLVVTRIKTLLIPLASFSIINSVWIFVLNPSVGLKGILYTLMGFFVELRGSKFDTGLWFISCLFVVQILYWQVYRLFKGRSGAIVGTLIFFSVIGFVYIRFIDHVVPWALEASLIAVGFFGVGNLLAQHGDTVKQILETKCGLISLAALVVNILIVIVNRRFGYSNDLYANQLALYPLYYGGAFSGIIFGITISMLAKKLRILQYIGVNSFIYYAFHKSVFASFSAVEQVVGFTIPETIEWIVFIVLASAILASVAHLINCYTPWMLGKIRKG